jgi:hypothetical protein
MTISVKAKARLAVAVTSKAIADELVAAIDAQGSGPAAVVTAFGTTTNLTPLVVSATTFAGAATAGASAPTATQVNTAIDAATALVKTALDLKADNADSETLRTQVEARLDALESKVNDILLSLKAAALMASS